MEKIRRTGKSSCVPSTGIVARGGSGITKAMINEPYSSRRKRRPRPHGSVESRASDRFLRVAKREASREHTPHHLPGRRPCSSRRAREGGRRKSNGSLLRAPTQSRRRL